MQMSTEATAGLLPTIAFSREFLQWIGIPEVELYALKPVFACRCERLTTTNRFVERGILITQDGELIVFDANPDTRTPWRITNRVRIGQGRPKKKLILEVDAMPHKKLVAKKSATVVERAVGAFRSIIDRRSAAPLAEDDIREVKFEQTVRLLTEPPDPYEAPKFNPYNDRNETEEEYYARLDNEAAARGEFLPDEDMVLIFHCTRAPIATQFVNIVRHFAEPSGEFYVELQEGRIMKREQGKRNYGILVKNLMQPPKSTKKAPTILRAVTTAAHQAVQEAKEEIFIPPPTQPPRVGGAKKSIQPVATYEFGITNEQMIAARRKDRRLRVEHLRKKKREEAIAEALASGKDIQTAELIALEKIDADPTLDLSDDDNNYLYDHLPHYKFDDVDAEDVAQRKKRKEIKCKRNELDTFCQKSDEEEEFDDQDGSSDSDAQHRKKMRLAKSGKKEAKKAKKEAMKAAKKRLKAQAQAERKRKRMLMRTAIQRRERERSTNGYRYPFEYREEVVDDPPPPLYRADDGMKKNKKGLFGFFGGGRRGKDKKNDDDDEDDSEEDDNSVSSSGSSTSKPSKPKKFALILVRPPPEEASLTLSSLAFYRRNVVVTLNPIRNPFESETYSVAVSSTGKFILCYPGDATNPFGHKLTSKKHKKATDNDRAMLSEGRGFGLECVVKCVVELSNHYCNGIRSGYVSLTLDLNAKKRRQKLRKRRSRDSDGSRSRSESDSDDASRSGSDSRSGSGSDSDKDDDDVEEDLRLVEMDFDDVCCGDMHPHDADCCSLEYFADVLRHFCPDAKVSVEEPPEPEYEDDDPEMQDDWQEAAAEPPAPPGAVMAECMIAEAAARASLLVDHKPQPVLLPSTSRRLSKGESRGSGDAVTHIAREAMHRRIVPQSSRSRVSNAGSDDGSLRLARSASETTPWSSRTISRSSMATNQTEVEKHRQHQELTKLLFMIMKAHVATTASQKASAMRSQGLHLSTMTPERLPSNAVRTPSTRFLAMQQS